MVNIQKVYHPDSGDITNIIHNYNKIISNTNSISLMDLNYLKFVHSFMEYHGINFSPRFRTGFRQVTNCGLTIIADDSGYLSLDLNKKNILFNTLSYSPNIKNKCKSSERYSLMLYQTLCNNTFQRSILNDNLSWTKSAALVSALDDKGDNYLKYYSVGGEGTKHKEVIDDIEKLEWYIL